MLAQVDLSLSRTPLDTYMHKVRIATIPVNTHQG
jgi:hypothetical protein